MAEEQAWLVRARSDSDNSAKNGFGTMAYSENRLPGTDGGGELVTPANMAISPPEPQDNDSGELLDYNDSSVLEQCHEDALRQAGCGLAQLRVILACWLAVVGASMEMSAIPFILPSAEIELCILPHEKNWLVLISLVGCSVGAAGWGAVGSCGGRRRALLSCLAVNAVFAAIAAFMPTYGTFMMARFCSAIGSGGIVPLCFVYVCEVVPRACRGRACAALCASAGAGARAALALASAALPGTGADTLEENKRHFSAWHRYLLLCTLPILASLVSLIWTPESPRYLLDVGREVDAMAVYQGLHSGNQFRLCSKGNVSGGGRAPAHHLGEIALPGKRRAPAAHKSHAHKVWQMFTQLFSNTYRKTTLSLGGTLVMAMAIQYYLSSYVPAVTARVQSAAFSAATRIVTNATLSGHAYNATLQNTEYTRVTFDNCSFRDILMSHVMFRNCTFNNVQFSNIRTSHTWFAGCVFNNNTIIDADIEVGGELDAWCVLNNTLVRGIRGTCSRHADLAYTLAQLTAEQSYLAHAMLIAAVLCLLPQKMRHPVVLAGLLIPLSPLLYLTPSGTLLYVLAATYRVLTTMLAFHVSCACVDLYPANLRCVCIGALWSAALVCGAGARSAPPAAPAAAALAAALAVAAAAAAAAS